LWRPRDHPLLLFITSCPAGRTRFRSDYSGRYQTFRVAKLVVRPTSTTTTSPLTVCPRQKTAAGLTRVEQNELLSLLRRGVHLIPGHVGHYDIAGVVHPNAIGEVRRIDGAEQFRRRAALDGKDRQAVWPVGDVREVAHNMDLSGIATRARSRLDLRL